MEYEEGEDEDECGRRFAYLKAVCTNDKCGHVVFDNEDGFEDEERTDNA